ncbi:MAG: efflux RND transporter periplasmic adaptor subunit [Gammaproteobacteria bacterium]|nr:efflux RND transporter periplasmic adaptor subunit [Gammaproteobacteria bacterium]
MKSHLKTIVVSLIIIVAISLFFYSVSKKKPVLISLGVAESGRVEAVVTNTRAGTVKACRRANLSPAIGGQIAKLNVKEGDLVEKGQILLELWNEDLVANIKLANNEVITALASADEACFRADVAQREAKRVVELQKKNLAAVEDVDRIVTNAKAVKAGCRAARAAADVSATRVDVVKAGLERTQLIAPFSGRVAEVTGELGEFVTPSPPGIPTPPAVDLIDTSCLYISAPIDEVDAPAIKTGMKARISLDAFSGKSFKGEVRRVAPYVLEKEKQARTVDMETYFVEPEEYLGLLPGYSADVEVILNVRENVLRIPTEAILDNTRVFIYNASEQILEERQIKTGLSNWKFSEIISGLNEGDQVVLSVDRKGVSDGVYAKPE